VIAIATIVDHTDESTEGRGRASSLWGPGQIARGGTPSPHPSGMRRGLSLRRRQLCAGSALVGRHAGAAVRDIPHDRSARVPGRSLVYPRRGALYAMERPDTREHRPWTTGRARDQDSGQLVQGMYRTTGGLDATTRTTLRQAGAGGDTSGAASRTGAATACPHERSARVPRASSPVHVLRCPRRWTPTIWDSEAGQ
jgi:hypothetical protein